MPNRRYTKFSQSRIRDNPSRSDVHSQGSAQPSFSGETTASWMGAAGPKGSGINKLNWPEVKQSAKQDMADDMHGHLPKAKKKKIKMEMEY